MKIILYDVNDSNCTVTLSESRDGNVVIEISARNVIVDPDELVRAARLFVKNETGERT